MNSTTLSTLRHRPLRRSVAALAMFALLLAGFAQASHFHKNETARSAQTHLQCLLCLHADRWAGTPELPKLHAPALLGGAIVVVRIASRPIGGCIACYDARGPPLA